MYNKKKNKKFKRIFALVGVVVIILSALVIPSGAWEVADIPFYNYFDCSKFGTTSEIGDRTDTAQIVSVNPETGFINMYAKFDDSRTFCLVPYSDINLKLSEVCPDLVLYESYVLSGEFYYDIEDGGEDCYFYNAQIYLVREDGSIEPWRIGQSLEISPDRLNSYVTFCAGRCRKPLDRPVSCGFRYWINKDNAAPFEPYDMFKNIKNEAYEQGKNEGYNAGLAEGTEKGYDEGYNAGLAEGTEKGYDEAYNLGHADGYSSGFTRGENKGYDDGYKAGHKDGLSSGKQTGYDEGYEDGYEANVMDSLMVSKRNLSLQMGFYDPSTQKTVYKTYGYDDTEELEYPYNGYSFNSNLLYSKYLTPPNDHSYLSQIHVMLIPRTYNNDYVVGSSQFSFILNDRYGYADISVVSDAIDNQLHMTSKRYPADQYENFVVNFSDFGLSDGDIIEAISITYVELGAIDEGFSFAFTDTTNNAYTVGVEEGRSQGYTKGYAEGLEKGTNEGTHKGYQSGYKEGHDEGYKEGDNAGYYRGRADESRKSGFASMIFAVVDAPVQAFKGLFNFNVLGFDMSAFALSIITVAICITVLKVIL